MKHMTAHRPKLKSPTASTSRFVFDLARPYRGWFIIILLAMLVEAAAGLAAPWPLKIVIDNAIGKEPLPGTFVHIFGPEFAASGVALAAAAALLLVLLAAVEGLAAYVDSYYTESV